MDAVNVFLSGRNISPFAVPVAFLIAGLPRAVSFSLAKRTFDPARPRTFTANVQSSEALDKLTKDRILRCEACFANGLETLGFFAGAVATGLAVGLPAKTMNTLSIAYLTSRLFFTLAYVRLQENRKLVITRPLAWWSGVLITIAMYVKAGMSL